MNSNFREVVLPKDCVVTAVHRKDQYLRCDVVLCCKVKTNEAGRPNEVIERQLRDSTSVPLGHVHPCACGCTPDVQMLCLEVVNRRGQSLRLLQERGDHLRSHRNAPVGVSLDQGLLIVPRILIINAVDHGKLSWVVDLTLKHLSRHCSYFVANARSIETRCGDTPEER